MLSRSVRSRPAPLRLDRRQLALAALYAYCFLVPFFRPVPFASLELGPLDVLFPIALGLVCTARRLRLSVVLGALLGYALLVLISVLWVHDPTAQAGAALRALRFAEIVAPFVLVATLSVSLRLVKRLISAFALGGGISVVLGIIIFVFQIPVGEVQRYAYPGGIVLDRAGGIFSDSSSYGHLVATWMSLTLLTLPALVKPRRALPWSLLVLVLGLVALYASLSRSAVLCLSAVGLLVLLTRFPKVWRKQLRRLVLVGLAFGAILISTAIALYPSQAAGAAQLVYQRLIVNTFGVLWMPEEANRITSGRVSNWLEYLPYVAENPLTGIGYKALRLERDVPPDNNYLAALVETGIVGLLALLVFFGSVLLTLAHKYRRGNPFAWALMVVWLGQLAMAVAIDIMTFWATMPALLAITGAVLGLKQPGRSHA